MLAREGDDRAPGALALAEIVADRVEVLDRALDPGGDDHGPRLPADLAEADHLLMEMIDHDLGFEPDRMVVALDIMAQLLLRPLGVEFGVGLDRLDQAVIALDRGVTAQHIEDEALLDRLLHRVAVEGAVPGPAVLHDGIAENLQGLRLRRRGEREVARVGQQLARLHDPVDAVFRRLLLVLLTGGGERHVHRGGGLAALARMRLVDDDRKAAVAVQAADVVEDEREFLDRGDDDFLAALDKAAQIARVLGMADRRADLGELPDRVAELLVEDAAVGHDDDRIEDRLSVDGEADQLVGEPGDRVRFPRPRRMLNQIPTAGAVRAGMRQQPAHDIELVVAREQLLAFDPTGPGVLPGDDLGVILDDVGEAGGRQDLLPQIVGGEAGGVRRISGAVVPALVERQKPRGFCPGDRVQNRTSWSSTAKCAMHRPSSNNFSRGSRSRLYCSIASSTVCLVRLFFSSKVAIGRPLTNSARSSAFCLGLAVAQLPGDREPVLRKTLGRERIAGRRRAIEQGDVVRAVPDAPAQHVDDPALADLALQPGEEFLPGRRIRVEVQGRGERRLGRRHKRPQLGEIDGPGAVVASGIAEQPAVEADKGFGIFRKPAQLGRRVRPPRHVRDDQRLQTFFRGIGVHIISIEDSSGPLRSAVITGLVPVIHAFLDPGCGAGRRGYP